MTTEPPPTSPPEDSRLEELLAECIEVVERDGEDAIEAFLRRCPDDAERLRGVLDRLRRLGIVRAERAAAGLPAERIGEYELIERLGATAISYNC